MGLEMPRQQAIFTFMNIILNMIQNKVCQAHTLSLWGEHFDNVYRNLWFCRTGDYAKRYYIMNDIKDEYGFLGFW